MNRDHREYVVRMAQRTAHHRAQALRESAIEKFLGEPRPGLLHDALHDAAAYREWRGIARACRREYDRLTKETRRAVAS